MRISSKGRYGIAAMMSMAQNPINHDFITIISIAEKLGISKIYLEQVFSLLKRAGLVISVKGAQGGYKLSRPPEKITAGQILLAVEVGLFEKTESSVSGEAMAIDLSMEAMIWKPLDSAVMETLDNISLSDLIKETEKHQKAKNMMFYI